jgi:hypothetical protein
VFNTEQTDYQNRAIVEISAGLSIASIPPSQAEFLVAVDEFNQTTKGPLFPQRFCCG